MVNLSSEIKTQILDIIFELLDPESTTVFLFGSQAEQTATKYSDIDIGLIGEERIADKTFLTLQDRLNYEVDTLRKIDLVDFGGVDETFKQFAAQKVELWHTAKNSGKKLPM